MEGKNWREEENSLYNLEFPKNEKKLEEYFKNFIDGNNIFLKPDNLEKNKLLEIDNILKEANQQIKLTSTSDNNKINTTNTIKYDENNKENNDNIKLNKEVTNSDNINKEENNTTFNANTNFNDLSNKDPDLAKLLYKWYEVGYMTCYYQV